MSLTNPKLSVLLTESLGWRQAVKRLESYLNPEL